MNNEIIANAKDVLDRARHIESMLNSKGWARLNEIVNQELEDMKDFEKIKTLRELERNQGIIRFWKHINNLLIDEVNQSEEALKIINN